MATKLYPYQKIGAEWLVGKSHALLADEMGLGKSAQAIKAADYQALKRILILCPAVARINWEREFRKFSNQNRQIQVAESRKDLKRQTDILISSYDLAKHIEKTSPWDLLILDEAHFLKNPDAQRTKHVFGKEGHVRYAKRTWALTGTPAPNHVGELWILLYTFGKTSLSHASFIERYCTYYDSPAYGRTITGSREDKIPELRQILGEMMLRRSKEEVKLELPTITYQDVVVPPGEVDLDVTDSFVHYVFPTDRRHELDDLLNAERKLLQDLTDKQGSFSVAQVATLQAISNSISTLRRYTGLQKVKATAELIKSELEVNAYEKIVIFAIHRDVIENMRVALKDYHPVTLYGGTPPDKRQKNIDKFQRRNSKHRVFIGNIQACGTAITLTEAHQVVFIEQEWTPGHNLQAAMRCHRIGQKNPVFVRFIGLAHSLDERIAHVLKRKTRELQQIFRAEVLRDLKPSASPDETDYQGDIFS